MTFERPIRVTILYSHANKRSDDYSSVAYWYQAETAQPLSPSNGAWTSQIPDI